MIAKMNEEPLEELHVGLHNFDNFYLSLVSNAHKNYH